MNNYKKYKEYVKKNVGLTLQFIFVLLVLIFGIITLFNKNFKIILEIILGLTLLIMSYNNYKFFKRKNMTIIYLLFGIVSIILSIFEIMGINI